MRVEFSVKAWSAWAPGLTTPDAWKAWAQAPVIAPVGSETPPLAEVPAMQRRRVEKLGRPAFQVATWCAGETKGIPLVFGSRHGDPGRGADLLFSLARGEILSPTSFALSVHNAVGAQFSIIRGDTANVTAISNGLFTAEAALIEAVSLLSEQDPEVMLVVYDAGPPDLYRAHWEEPDADFAYAWRISRGSDFALENVNVPATRSDVIPQALSVLRFFLRDDRELTRGDEISGWRWSRRG